MTRFSPAKLVLALAAGSMLAMPLAGSMGPAPAPVANTGCEINNSLGGSCTFSCNAGSALGADGSGVSFHIEATCGGERAYCGGTLLSCHGDVRYTDFADNGRCEVTGFVTHAHCAGF